MSKLMTFEQLCHACNGGNYDIYVNSRSYNVKELHSPQEWLTNPKFKKYLGLEITIIRPYDEGAGKFRSNVMETRFLNFIVLGPSFLFNYHIRKLFCLYFSGIFRIFISNVKYLFTEPSKIAIFAILHKLHL